MTRRAFQHLPVRDLAPIGLAAAVLLWAVTAGVAPAGKGPPNPKKNGSYKVLFAGYATGSGSASVGPQNLSITGTVVTEVGERLSFQASALAIEDGRFNGAGTLNGSPVEVSGRVDAPDGTLKTSRLMGMYRTVDGKAGRIAGAQQGSSKGKDD